MRAIGHHSHKRNAGVTAAHTACPSMFPTVHTPGTPETHIVVVVEAARDIPAAQIAGVLDNAAKDIARMQFREIERASDGISVHDTDCHAVQHYARDYWVERLDIRGQLWPEPKGGEFRV